VQRGRRAQNRRSGERMRALGLLRAQIREHLPTPSPPHIHINFTAELQTTEIHLLNCHCGHFLSGSLVSQLKDFKHQQKQEERVDANELNAV